MAIFSNNIDIVDKCFINGNLFTPNTKSKFFSISPINSKKIVKLADCDENILNMAVSGAVGSFNSRDWLDLSIEKKQKSLIRLANLIKEHEMELAYLDAIDSGKPIRHCLNIDIPATIKCIEWYANLFDKIYDRSFQLTSADKLFIEKVPVGIVAGIVPWNFPLYISALKFAPALMTGNSVILKPSEKASLVLLYLGYLVSKIDSIPPGTFNVITGGKKLGEAIGKHEHINCISFTGSSNVGKKFLRYSSESNMKRVFLECGGKSPVIVFRDYNKLKEVAQQIAFNVFFNQGAACSAPVRVIAEKEIVGSLVELLVDQTKKYNPSDPLDMDTNMGPIIDKQHLENIINCISIEMKERNNILYGGKKINPVEGGFYLEPTIIHCSTLGKLLSDEIFGPVITIETFSRDKKLRDIIDNINKSKYGLTASIFSGDLTKALILGQKLRVGTVSINKITDGSVMNPFGGFRESGVGRERAIDVLYNYTEVRSTLVNYQETF